MVDIKIKLQKATSTTCSLCKEEYPVDNHLISFTFHFSGIYRHETICLNCIQKEPDTITFEEKGVIFKY